MAIAYFIPDQAKLLARTSGNNNNNSNSQQNNEQPSQGVSGSSQQTSGSSSEQQQQQQQQQQQRPQQQRYGSHFRANISVPLARQQGNMLGASQDQQDLGCWELLAQIFCYALRLYSYNSTQRTPTVIQISFEISSGPPTGPGESDRTDDDVSD
ncbi:cell death protein Grim [Scaptodrosophila lebanonensis]|uniref:Cell death protein Grim n=1 Tax=Drosophila lebanonensis TaxID=7225 RepID=A0A6J2TAT7_DROLE|nr:cell death protein Grim [Scaptodrosophila lebanonensis]